MTPADDSDYELLFDERALKELESLEQHIRTRIFQKLISAKGDPHRFFLRLAGRKDHRLRIGDYRAIADIDDQRKQIRITLIGHRKDIYTKEI